MGLAAIYCHPIEFLVADLMSGSPDADAAGTGDERSPKNRGWKI